MRSNIPDTCTVQCFYNNGHQNVLSDKSFCQFISKKIENFLNYLGYYLKTLKIIKLYSEKLPYKIQFLHYFPPSDRNKKQDNWQEMTEPSHGLARVLSSQGFDPDNCKFVVWYFKSKLKFTFIFKIIRLMKGRVRIYMLC